VGFVRDSSESQKLPVFHHRGGNRGVEPDLNRRQKVFSMTSIVMSREEFDSLFGATLSSVDDWKLSSVLLHMRDIIGERVGSRRSSRRRNSRMTKSERRERSNQKRIARRDTYNAYLTSQTWYYLRIKILERDSYRCVCCGKPATQVHHRSYAPKVLAGRANDKLASVCGLCHHRIHFYDDETRVRKCDVDRRFLELRRQCR